MNNYMTYKSYIGTVNYNADDEVFHGKINGINDLITFEGQSVKELKKSFHDSVNDYLETCRELGKQPDKTYKGSFNVRISTELHRKATAIATKKQISLNDFVKRAIYYAVAHEKDIDDNLAFG